MTTHRPLTAAALLSAALFAAPAEAQTTHYSFAGIYNTAQNGSPVTLAYTGSFSIADPVLTATKPAYAADVFSPSYAGIWAGNSSFYTGAGALQLSFANGASLTAPSLGLVVNNTTFSGAGAPYPPGLSVQLYAEGATASGMTASMVCPDGSTDTLCDDSGIDPLYRRGDASDLAVQRITGIYFAFWGAPLSSAAAGVPDLVTAFGASGGGLGIFASNDLGQPTTTLTSFNRLSAVSTAPVPEPSTYALMLAGLLGLAGWRSLRKPHAAQPLGAR
jgi:hypothetical protein